MCIAESGLSLMVIPILLYEAYFMRLKKELSILIGEPTKNTATKHNKYLRFVNTIAV